MKESFEKKTYQILSLVILIAMVCIGIGGILYLIEVGFLSFSREGLHYQTVSIFIYFGLFMLIMVQVLKVVLTTWFFAQLQERYFIVISLFILIVLIFSFLSCIILN